MYSSGQDSSFSSEGSHFDTRAVKMQKRRKLAQESNEEQQRDSSTKESVSFANFLLRAAL